MKNAGKTNTFLMELIIVILFFSLSAAITLQLFVTAHTQSSLSRDKSMAVLKAQSVVEQIKADGEASGADGQPVYFDENWELASSGPYELLLQSQEERAESGQLLHLTVRVNKGEKELCALEAEHYLPDEEGAQ